MLLLLTLALLASPTCRAQNVLGRSVGDYFYVQGEDHGELKGMRVFLSLLKFIKGIQLQFGNYWSEVYGSRSPNSVEFLLEDGEHVIKVNGSAMLCLTSLTFTTNKGRVATFGVRRGRFFDNSGGSDKHLLSVDGTHTPGLCITGMGFKWEENEKVLMPTERVKVSRDSSDISKEKEGEGRDEDEDEDDEDNGKDDDYDDDDDGDDDDDDDDDKEDEEEE
ncbi:Spermine-binding protein-like [Apodemus speciosus]|uniref:Spermine-binding protein-like n=1 Tax=Apodemus speciosus TaxID=105296 RepID=A0ABQ0FN30_APOSI